MTDTTYNGWKNYPTWNLRLWVDNEEPLHMVPVEILERIASDYDPSTKPDYFTREEVIRGDFMAELQAWAEETFLDPFTEPYAGGNAGPCTDILRWGWGHIEWHEIAQSYMDDNPEVWQE